MIAARQAGALDEQLTGHAYGERALVCVADVDARVAHGPTNGAWAVGVQGGGDGGANCFRGAIGVDQAAAPVPAARQFRGAWFADEDDGFQVGQGGVRQRLQDGRGEGDGGDALLL